MMIISIDGYFQEILLTGKKCSSQELKQKYLQARKLAEQMQDLPYVFSRLHRFDVLPWDVGIEVDYVIDTDTDQIYIPTY
ncbi:hypothetical protein QWY14_03100 [Planococcus sp. N028]|uniref:Uncharacterized protein n=1 Tax=Planococcus shixiaomingii TaxID=3058393 RepID=A0ABT8MZ69_9BACL|nr:hypothetical protein [Planococcus sp. N028]MDN7240757.1 hypothetical protein [Planococcus sp. N028]